MKRDAHHAEQPAGIRSNHNDPSGEMMSDTKDRLFDLIARIAQQDEAALVALYRQFGSRVFAFSLQRLDEPGLAEEVVSETMYEVWRHAARFRGESSASTWILGIARNKALDKLRARGHAVYEDIDDHADLLSADQPGGFERIAAAQQAEQVARCMDGLPSDQRECLHLAFYEDLPLADIADLQGCPVNTVKTRLFHARRKMKLCIETQLSLHTDQP